MFIVKYVFLLVLAATDMNALVTSSWSYRVITSSCLNLPTTLKVNVTRLFSSASSSNHLKCLERWKCFGLHEPVPGKTYNEGCLPASTSALLSVWRREYLVSLLIQSRSAHSIRMSPWGQMKTNDLCSLQFSYVTGWSPRPGMIKYDSERIRYVSFFTLFCLITRPKHFYFLCPVSLLLFSTSNKKKPYPFTLYSFNKVYKLLGVLSRV